MKPPPPRDPEHDHSDSALASRRRYLGLSLPHCAGEPCSPDEAKGSVEGMIGYAQVPLGIAGPLSLKGDFQGEYIVPFATTEGTMVASYQRGMRVTAEAGGITAHVLRDALGVWPTIAFASVSEALSAARFVEENRAMLIEAAESTTRTGRVLDLRWELLGSRLVIYLEMFTGDAHGINMATKAASALLARIPSRGQTLVHGKDVEKRATTHHWRGKWVVAECLLPGALVRERLRTSPAEMEEAWRTYGLAFGRMGTQNHALQIANGLAGIYVATGQDAAYVAESAVGTLSLEERAGDLYASLDLPNLHAALVGGGTQKGTAAECQAILGAKSARELACVMAGALLAGDINLMATFTRPGFVEAHERLGRNRPSAEGGPASNPLSLFPPSLVSPSVIPPSITTKADGEGFAASIPEKVSEDKHPSLADAETMEPSPPTLSSPPTKSG